VQRVAQQVGTAPALNIRMVTSRWLLSSLVAASFAATVSPAHAAGSLFLVEISTGLSEPTHASGDVGLSYGLTTGITWKLVRLPIRFHLLGTITGRSAHGSGLSHGLAFSSERQDVDLYGSLRLGLPIVGGLRIYGEGGVGARWSAQSIQRGGGLGGIDASASTPIVVGAVGLDYRVMEALSFGLRGEVTGTTRGDDVLGAITGEGYEAKRFSLLAQVGFHF